MNEPAPGGLPQESVIALFRECGALLEGHFLLTSGLHSPFYLQCARVLMDPRRAERVAEALAAKLRAEQPELGCEVVIAPALGGLVLGHELARQLGALSMFVERVEGRFALRRGFALEPGARVLIAEDVVTTGLSSRECIECVAAAGGDVRAAACLIDRSDGKARLGVPLVALARLELPVYRPEEVPPDLAARPALKPGSRQPTGR